MQLPTPLSRRNKKSYKNNFGHAFIIAGSKRMLGAAALSGLSSMRAGAGLTTCGIPKSLNAAMHKRSNPVLMTFPLNETKEQSISFTASSQIKSFYKNVNVIAIGPGLSRNASTSKLVLEIIRRCPHPMVIDADALFALRNKLTTLSKTKVPKILTPHSGEFARIINVSTQKIERNRRSLAEAFALKNKCILVLKGHQTVVASHLHKTYINKTGNVSLATAGSGDVLTGIIAGLLAQGCDPFVAAKFGTWIHGKAGEMAAKKVTKASMIATDIIDQIPRALKND